MYYPGLKFTGVLMGVMFSLVLSVSVFSFSCINVFSMMSVRVVMVLPPTSISHLFPSVIMSLTSLKERSLS